MGWWLGRGTLRVQFRGSQTEPWLLLHHHGMMIEFAKRETEQKMNMMKNETCWSSCIDGRRAAGRTPCSFLPSQTLVCHSLSYFSFSLLRLHQFTTCIYKKKTKKRKWISRNISERMQTFIYVDWIGRIWILWTRISSKKYEPLR